MGRLCEASSYKRCLSRRGAWASVAVLAGLGGAWAGCGGTTGREYLQSAAVPDATAADEGGAESAAPDGAGSESEPSASDTALPEASAPDAASPAADATVSEASADGGAQTDATQADLDDGTFDVVILYADRALPDVHAPPDAGAGAHEAGGPEAGREDGSACIPYNSPSGPDGGPIAPLVGCTATEQKFVDKSLNCYSCLITGTCLDDTEFGDTNNECEDVEGNATGGDQPGVSNKDICLQAVDCIFANKCASTDVGTCYCGKLGAQCALSSAPGDGPCAQIEANGVNEFGTTAASTVAPLLGNRNTAAGKATAIFACSILNGCAAFCNP